MKKVLALILVLTLAFSLAACGDDTPADTEKDGFSESTKDTEKPDKNYRLDTVTTYNPDGSVNSVASYAYDAEGNNIAITETGPDGSFYSKELYAYENGLKMTDACYRDEETNLSSTGEYSYDEQGNQIGYISYMADGTVGLRNVYEYDAQGHMVKLTQYSDDGSVFAAFTYTWDGDNMTGFVAANSNGEVETEAALSYDDRGNCVLAEYDFGDGFAYTIAYTYDENDLLQSTTWTSSTGELLSREEYAYVEVD